MPKYFYIIFILSILIGNQPKQVLADENPTLIDPQIKGFFIDSEGISFYISRPCPESVKNEYVVSHKATRSIPPTIMIRLHKKDSNSRDCMKIVPNAMPLRFSWDDMDINYSGNINVTVTNELYPDSINLKKSK